MRRASHIWFREITISWFLASVMIMMCNTCISQDSTKSHLYLKIHPLSIIDFSGLRMQGSLEIRMPNKWGGEFTYGKNVIFNYYGDTMVVAHPRGQMLKLEIKHNLRMRDFNTRHEKNLQPYFGFALWHMELLDNVGNYGFYVRNRIVAFNAGATIDYGRFTIDALVCGGLRYKERRMIGLKENISYTNNIISAVGQVLPYHFKGWLPHIGASVRVGFRIF
jgi:hypothetical protein